jgi:hypothetical protein
MEAKEPVFINIKKLETKYQQWKGAVSPLYDYLVVECLAWPTLTLQWLPINDQYFLYLP